MPFLHKKKLAKNCYVKITQKWDKSLKELGKFEKYLEKSFSHKNTFLWENAFCINLWKLKTNFT